MKKHAIATKATSRRSPTGLDIARRAANEAQPRTRASPIGGAAVKHMLAYVDGTPSDRIVLDYAAQIALRFGAHVDVLYVRFDARGTTRDNGHAGVADRLLAEPVESSVSAAAARARQHFDAWHAQCKLPALDSGIAAHGPSTQWREVLGYESDVIARLGRLSDLVLLARGGATSSSAMALETALFETGGPVLMLPAGAPANIFHRPLVAWNGSREAARAVHFALPFLCELESCVEIFAAPESKHHTDTKELLRYLGWHGITAARLSADEASGLNLLAQASAIGAGLIVMGAYTHGHYRQFLFGGMTRHVLEHAAIPVLLAH